MIENAQLVGLSKQMALRRQLDVVANNMANINSTGFKAESLMFEEYQMPLARDRTFMGPDQPLSFTQDWATLHDMKAGAIAQSGNPLDVAIGGEGFFALDGPGGDLWTRNGVFQIDAQGTLVNQNGYPVQTEGGGAIQFAADETDITIAPDGTVSSSAGNKGRLRVVTFADPQALAHAGDTAFSGGTPIAATNPQLVQGAVERSNVSGITEMSEMVRVTRAYTSLADLMGKQDEMRRTAIQRLGDTQG